MKFNMCIDLRNCLQAGHRAVLSVPLNSLNFSVIVQLYPPYHHKSLPPICISVILSFHEWNHIIESNPLRLSSFSQPTDFENHPSYFISSMFPFIAWMYDSLLIDSPVGYLLLVFFLVLGDFKYSPIHTCVQVFVGA